MQRKYLARDPENAQRKIRRGDYRDMERAERDLEELENIPDAEERGQCPPPLPEQKNRTDDEKKDSF